MPTRVRLLIADPQSGAFLASHFGSKGFDVRIAENGEELLRSTGDLQPTIVILDLSLSGMPAITVLERLKEERSNVKVVILGDAPDPAAVFRISKLGADELLVRPVQVKDLETKLTALAQLLLSEQMPNGPILGKTADLSLVYGSSPAMEEIRNTIEQVADTTATVLIRGESGTGKEVTARMIYAHSSRRDRPFVKVNCAAIPHELLESELFGYESGAFTGAVRQRLGKFEQANYGTIFLDEISEMHPSLQAKLLHVLQDGSFSRLGGKREIHVDVRVIAATNKDIEEAVGQGQFREDLFYRLNVITFHIPPLRERREEIPVLVTYFLHKYGELYAKKPPTFSDAAMQRILDYSWPGNIRELENMAKRYVIVGNEPQIIRELSNARAFARPQPVHITPDGNRRATPPPPRSHSEALPEEGLSLLEIGRRAAMKAEYEVIERVLIQTRWNRRQAAKILKVSYKALLNKLKAMEEAKSASEAEQTST